MNDGVAIVFLLQMVSVTSVKPVSRALVTNRRIDHLCRNLRLVERCAKKKKKATWLLTLSSADQGRHWQVRTQPFLPTYQLSYLSEARQVNGLTGQGRTKLG